MSVHHQSDLDFGLGVLEYDDLLTAVEEYFERRGEKVKRRPVIVDYKDGILTRYFASATLVHKKAEP